MFTKFKRFYSHQNHKLIRSIILVVILPIIILRLFGITQWLELTIYDSMFYFSPEEPTDERIVIVGWTEEDIQRTKEMTLSDDLLNKVIEKIKAQKPRLIGLDLYRDIPYSSRLLTREENDLAYQKLQEIFRSTTNLLGIEKVRPPLINPPLVLKEEERVFSSDLIVDGDNIIRRSFIDPNPLEIPGDASTETEAPYIGTVLATDYLAEEGWEAIALKNGSLNISKDQKTIILENVKPLDGTYIDKDYRGLDFLVRWRKAKFTTLSVDELMKAKNNLLTDKIVLIANIAASTADRHHFSLVRWDKKKPWTEGAYIQAQIISYVISSTLDGRSVLQVAPGGLGYLLFLLSIIVTAYFILKYYDIFEIQNLYSLTILYSLGLSVFLYVLSLFAFWAGWWIPITPSLLGIALTAIYLNHYVQIDKEHKNSQRLELICLDLNHELGNSTNSIQLNNRGIKNISRSLYENLKQSYCADQSEGLYSSDDDFSDTENSKSINLIKERIEVINSKIESITKYRNRTTAYLDLTSRRKRNPPRITNINQLVKQIVEEFVEKKEQEKEYKIFVKQLYDKTLDSQRIETIVVQIVLSNLLDNAFYIVNPEFYQDSSYSPQVTIETKKRDKFFEISVKDNGIGIPKHKQQEIFKPFVSFKNDRGQGIGLAIVQDIVKLEQGKIKLESQLGKGSKFTVSFPKK